LIERAAFDASLPVVSRDSGSVPAFGPVPRSVDKHVSCPTRSVCFVLERAPIYPAPAASSLVSDRSSSLGMRNSALPQFKQTRACGNTQTGGLSRPSRPGQWSAISALNVASFSAPHDLHATVRPLQSRPSRDRRPSAIFFLENVRVRDGY
jgi:hypothetical protein